MYDRQPVRHSDGDQTGDSERKRPERVLVVQQNGSGTRKIEGIRSHANGRIVLETFSIDVALPEILDDTSEYLPHRLEADLVLDFLIHPDLSYDLALQCRKQGLPLVASGKRHRVAGALTPPT